MSAKHLDEAAHVGTLEVVRQIDRHREMRDRLLSFVLPVEDHDRVTKVGDSDLVEGYAAVVGEALDILQELNPPRDRHSLTCRSHGPRLCRGLEGVLQAATRSTARDSRWSGWRVPRPH